MLPLDDLADGKTVDVTQEFSLGSGTIKYVRQEQPTYQPQQSESEFDPH